MPYDTAVLCVRKSNRISITYLGASDYQNSPTGDPHPRYSAHMPDRTPNTTPDNFKAQGPERAQSTSLLANPIYEISVANSRKLDELATTQYAIPSIVLMENAAIGLCNHAIQMLQTTRSQDILIATGPGNNAGDGFAGARHLANLGFSPTIILTNPPNKFIGDAKINLDIITKMNLHMIDAEHYLNIPQPFQGLIIDALFGTGLTRPIVGLAAKLITYINKCKQAGSQVLAVDVPSGLNAQTGEPIGDPNTHTIICATRTVTFAAIKEGYRNIESQPFLGDVHIAPIGIPTQLLDQLATKVHHPHDRS